MCTVTYLPQPGGHFILSSNRDENAARSPQQLSFDQVADARLLFPMDTGAGGTWIAAADDNRVACVLNGAFEKHQHCPPYRRSRGLMVLDYFSYPDTHAFVHQYDFEGIEPFTLILVDKDRPFELRWDSTAAHFRELDPHGRYLWSSATLYPGEVGQMRQTWFEDWLHGREDFNLEAIQQFHLTGGEGDTWNGFVMNRMGKVQTVSLTNLVKTAKGIELIYHDLLRESVKQDSLSFR